MYSKHMESQYGNSDFWFGGLNQFFVDVKFGNDICYSVMALGSTQPLTEMSTMNISWE